MNRPGWFRALSRIDLGWKISVLMVAIILLTGISSIIVMETTLAKNLYAEHDDKGFAIARNLAANVAEPILLDNLVHVQLLLTNLLDSENDMVYAFIVSPDNRVVAHTFTGGFPKQLLTVHKHKPGEEQKHEIISTEEGIIHDISVPLIRGEMGYIHLGLSHEAVNTKIASVRMRLITILILISLSAIALSLLVSRFITRPLSSLAEAATNIRKGNLAHRVQETGDDEVGRLAIAFNAMADRLQKDLEIRIEMEKALQNSEALYRSLIENIDLGITLVDKDLTIMMANKAMGVMFNKTVDDLRGKKCYQEFEKRKSACLYCTGREAMELKEPRETISEAVRDDGSTFIVRIRAFPVLNQKNEPTGFIEVIEDVTKQKRLDEELQRTKKIESIGILAGGIAHDFNNLLTGIIGNLSLANEYCKEEKSPLCDRIRETEKAALRAKDLTQQLLTFSTGGSPILSLTDMRKLIMESVDFYLSGSNIKGVYDLADDLLFANVDGNQISQVIQNLVTNAKEAMPKGGIIEVSAHNTELTEGSPIPLPSGKYIRISLKDHGTGIHEEFLPKIFDPFFTCKESGSGLGLAISYSIVNRHNGHITVESKEGKGTTFIIYLPASEQKVVPIRKEREIVKGTGHILVMDDEEMVLELARNMLNILGYTSSLSRNGEEALAFYQKALENGKPFDLVIMDLTIPGGMGGKEAINRIRELDPSVKAIVSSGYSNDPIMSAPTHNGFSGCIEKPYTLEKLSRVLHEIMNG